MASASLLRTPICLLLRLAEPILTPLAHAAAQFPSASPSFLAEADHIISDLWNRPVGGIQQKSADWKGMKEKSTRC